MDAFEMRFHEKLTEDIGAEIKERTGHVANGACQTFDNYKYRTGVLAGLALALSLADTTRKALIERGGA